MTTTTTYMSDLGRIRVAFSSAPAGTDYAKVERSIDGINWSTVRGGDTVAAVSGAGKVDDYEFVAGVLNTYRVTYIDTGAVPAYVAAGTAQTGNNTSLTPPHPAGLATGDFKLILASIRSSGTGTVNVPTGWASVATTGNFSLLGRTHQVGDTAPLVTFAAGAANDDTLAQMIAIRGSQTYANVIKTLLNPSAQDITGLSATFLSACIVLTCVWKQDDYTSTATPASGVKIAEITSTAGNDAGMSWSYNLSGTGNIGVSYTPPWPITVTGGATAISRSMIVMLAPADNVGIETSTITPTLTSAWFKVPSRPSLNAPVTISWDGSVTRPARTALFDVLGRTVPVAVTDVQGSRRLTLTLIAQSISEANSLDQKLSTGEPVFIQAPSPTSSVPTLYAAIGDVTQIRPSNRALRRYFSVPLTEVAAPGSTVYSDTYTYADVALDFATYADVIAATATYSDLVDKISNNEVIVT